MILSKARILALVCTSAFGADVTIPSRENVIVHEWGTFTSVAAPDGTPLTWAPLAGPGDLPCFVVRGGTPIGKWTPALIRMETPVLYFYPDRAMTLSVAVDFPEGIVTEWYPKASLVKPDGRAGVLMDGRIEWSKVELRPGDTAALPTTAEHSHYFAARETDSAMLRVGDQREKLLFYRGVGNFTPVLQPRLGTDGKVEIRSSARETLPLVMLFENQQGKIGFRAARNVGKEMKVDSPELSSNVAAVQQALAAALEESGLYRKEALAMVETWKDSWFEEGMRLIYILPGASVNAVLPLKISPAPAETRRVFVGRVEMLSPHVRETIETAVRSGDVSTLARMGRFLSPFEQQMRSTSQIVRSQEGQRVLSMANIRLFQALNPGACVQ